MVNGRVGRVRHRFNGTISFREFNGDYFRRFRWQTADVSVVITSESRASSFLQVFLESLCFFLSAWAQQLT